MKFPFKFERTPEFKEVMLVSALVALLAMMIWISTGLGRWSDRYSYDALVVMLREPPPRDTIIVYIDERSHTALDQRYGRTWDRRLHTRVLDFLTQEGAKLVYFDILFDQANEDPAVDVAFAEAIKRHGGVILGGSISGAQDSESTQQQVLPPISILRRAAKAWGGLTFFPIDVDAVRQVPVRLQDINHAAWHAAKILRGGSEPRSQGGDWLRYSGPPGSYGEVSYHQLLQPDGVPAGLFKDKVVLIGARATAGLAGAMKDTFATPYSRFGRAWMSGTEVNANVITTLRQDSALRKVSPLIELVVLVLMSTAFTWWILGLRPATAAFAAAAAAAIPAAVAWFAGAYLHWWGNWVLFSGLIVPTALVTSIGRNYYNERLSRQRVMRAFEKYLSPEMVRQAALSKVDLKPGGTTRRITAMMTDIKGFSSVAEKMTPAELSGMLVAYFSELTKHIFDYKGTILQFAGDGSYSVWGAPLEHAEPADQAVRAALALQAAMREGKLSETRVGISTGTGLCGNLGSYDRFDYTVIGDNTNLASRLEGANKKLGTHVLLADSSRRELRNPWVLREVGDFLVAGRDTPVKLWEPIIEGTEIPHEWRATLEWFAKGLAAWRAGDPVEAGRCFKEASESRGEAGDAPSQFYLTRMALHARRASDNAIGGAISLSKD